MPSAKANARRADGTRSVPATFRAVNGCHQRSNIYAIPCYAHSSRYRGLGAEGLSLGEGHEQEEAGKATKVAAVLAEKFPPGSRHQFAMVALRDGVRLATDVFLPPGGGPWPVLFCRGYYGRLNIGFDARETQGGLVAYVCQDCARHVRFRRQRRRQGHGRGCGTPRLLRRAGLDRRAAVVQRPRRHVGASGNGVGPLAGFLSKNSHLVVSCSTISSPWPYGYWGFHNGTRRFLYGWLSHAGLPTPEWPKPTIPAGDMTAWPAMLAAAASDNRAALVVTGGWYDISPEAVLDVYSACAATCRVFATISPNGHGGHCPFTWPTKKPSAAMSPLPSLADVLVGKDKLPEKSRLAYFLMGNFREPSSPGNYYKVVSAWPVPNTPTAFYFHADGSLSAAKPAEADGSLGYAFDPRDPAPTIGIKTALNSGPHDQRPLKDRKDSLRFVAAPLDAPLEVTGKIRADLYISTDVTDTEFVVKLIDIHPDGYEMLIRESAILGRYAEEFHGRPAPLEKGHVYQLKMDMRSTAILLDKGHRLAVLVTSGSRPEYEVHPNTFEPVMSFDKSPVAHQVLHLSSRHPSCITLPVVAQDNH